MIKLTEVFFSPFSQLDLTDVQLDSCNISKWYLKGFKPLNSNWWVQWEQFQSK